MNRTLKVIGITAAALLLMCISTLDIAGIQGSGRRAVIARGTITRFGSIFVNGVEYTTSGADIVVDDQPGSEGQLHAGQVVTLNGTVNSDGTTGTATGVAFSGNVEGPATQINAPAGRFVVLGQTVRVNDSTLYDDGIQPADLTGLTPGMSVEVSGFPDAKGDIVASRIDLKSAEDTLRVTGALEALDTTAHTFKVNGLTVDYGSATVEGTLGEGTVVEAAGNTMAGASELVATTVEVSPGLGAVVGEDVDLSGIITGVTSLLQFVLQGQVVIIDPLSTHLVLHGIPLGLNIEVDVKGTVTPSGALLAKKIEVKSHGHGLLRGLVDSVSATANTLSVSGVNVTADSSTAMVDKSSQHLRIFSLNDLRVGDYVEIHGISERQGGLFATSLRRDKPPRTLHPKP